LLFSISYYFIITTQFLFIIVRSCTAV